MAFLVNQIAQDSFSEPANSSGWFDGEFYKGRYFIAARGTAGLSVIDCADPTAPVEVDSIQISFNPATMPGNFARSMGLVIIGDMAYMCCRRGAGNDPGFGIVEEFDISDPTNVVATGNLWDPNDSQLVTPDHPNAYSYMFSDLATDGTHIFVAGQGSGMYKLLASDLASGPIASIEAQIPSDVIETQGVGYDSTGDYVLFANYTYGLRIIDNATWGQVLDVAIPRYDTGTVKLRPWQVTCRAGWAYVASNIVAPDEDSPLRGLLTIDLRGDVSSLTVSDWNYTQIPSAYNDTWNLAGDAPQLDVSLLGSRCFLSNGQQGVLWFDVSEPDSATFGGQFGTLVAGDNLYLTKAGRVGSRSLVLYGDAYQTPATNGSKTLYIAEVDDVAVALGNTAPADGSGGVFINKANGRGCNASYDYTAEEGDYFDRIRAAVESQPAARTIKFGIYRKDTGAKVHEEDVAFDPGGYPYTGLIVEMLSVRVPLVAGVTYTFRTTHVSGGVNWELDNYYSTSSLAMRQVTNPSDGVLPADLTSDADYAASDAILAVLGGNFGGGAQGIIGSIIGRVRR